MTRVLVIDDDSSIRDVMRKILEKEGHEVQEAGDGEEGMRFFRNGSYDLVVTDLIMPDKEGIETILELREEAPDVTILAVSGGLSVSKTGPLTDAKALGADATLEKPFSVSEFTEAVRRLL